MRWLRLPDPLLHEITRQTIEGRRLAIEFNLQCRLICQVTLPLMIQNVAIILLLAQFCLAHLSFLLLHELRLGE